MSDNPVRALLDAVSSGQPHAHRLSVDDLVRAGRRRQRVVATSVAGGTAAVVAGAAVMVTLTGARSTSGAIGVASTGPDAADTAPASLPPGTTAQPNPSGAPGTNRPVTTLTTVIGAAHLLSSGKQVGTFVVTDGCPTTPRLRVVGQDAHQVVVSLQLAVGDFTSAAAGPSAGTPSPAVNCQLVAISPKTGVSGIAVSGKAVKDSAEVIADLKAPLGTRALIDQATGKAIPYTADTQTAYPTWLPAGWHDTSGVRPIDLQSWEQDWSTAANALLSLRQTFDAADQLGGSANGQVNGQPARVVTGARGSEVTWWAQGRLYNLTASNVVTCTISSTGTSAPDCTPATESTTLPMTQADLLRVADSVKAR